MKKKPKIIALILLLLIGAGSLLFAIFGQPVYDDHPRVCHDGA